MHFRPSLFALGLLGISVFVPACGSSGDDAGTSEASITEPSAPAAELAAVCRAAEIVAIDRPLTSAAPARGTFRYRVHFRRPAKEGLPTVVHLPGGPGSTSIGHTQAWVPAEYGLVQTDPRGVGCNPVAEVDAESFYRTDEIANDVVAAIAELRTKGMGRFIVHGHSYGTVLATHVAHRLAEPGQPRPEAVILEGVLGRGFTNEWMAQSYVDEWQVQKARLSPAALAVLREPKPLGFDGKVWGNFFMILTSQFGPEQAHAALALLEPDGAGKPVQADREKLREALETYGKIQVSTGAALTLQKLVACRELTRDLPEDNVDVVLDGGEIVKSPDAGTLCRGLSIERPFHARDHLFPFRTYYFLGDHDTATPPWQGKLHFDTLTSADRVEVVVKNAGHLPLSGHLAECGPSLVERVAAGQGFGAALEACGAPVEVRAGTAR